MCAGGGARSYTNLAKYNTPRGRQIARSGAIIETFVNPHKPGPS